MADGWVISGGMATFQTVNYGTISVTLDTFNGFSDQVRDLSRTSPTGYYHEYNSLFQTGIQVGEVPLSDLVNALSLNPTPGTGYWFGYANATPGPFFPAPMFVYEGQSANGVIINITVDNLHVLDPGVVQRRFVVINGEYYIETLGIGEGYLATVNSWAPLVNAVWSAANSNVMQHLLDEGLIDLQTRIEAGWQTQQCFLSGTPVLLMDGTARSIDSVVCDDWVQSYDAAGNLVPGRVRRVIRNRVRHVLDVFGLMVTPGHVTLCGDGPFAGQHVPILDILRSDGALVRADGSFVRAATGVPLGHADDGFVWAVTGQITAEGFVVNEARALRRGTRVLTAAGHDFSLAELIAANGGTITDDGLVLGSSGQGVPFVWTLSSRLPGPEDYVLARSAVTLEDIFHAAEWEDQLPSMPAPRTLQPADIEPEPNTPLALRAERATGEQGPRSFAAAVSRRGERVQ